MFRRRTVLLASAALAVAALAACSGSPEPVASDDAQLDDTHQVGYLPLAHTASIINADEAGHFETVGLTVELLPTEGGAAAISALTSGGLDITYSNHVSALLAASQGLPIRLIAGNDVGAGDHGIFVRADSGIENPGDLAGRTFAVNNLKNIGTLAVYSLLADEGVDADEINLVEMPFPDMQAALERGDVDAIWQVEPFQASAEAAGFVKISDMFAGSFDDAPVAGWITTAEFADAHPAVIEAFRTAITASEEELAADDSIVVELIPTYTQIPEAVAGAIVPPTFQPELSVAELQNLADLMLEYGILTSELDVSTLILD